MKSYKKKGNSQKNNTSSWKAYAFWQPTVEKPPLILTGIVRLHSTSNAPFAVVSPNRAYQISRTLGKEKKQKKKTKATSMQKKMCFSSLCKQRKLAV